MSQILFRNFSRLQRGYLLAVVAASLAFCAWAWSGPDWQGSGAEAPEEGTLLVCGGGQLPNVVRDRFLDLAGGRHARIVVLPTVQETAQHSQDLRDLCNWCSAGVARVEVLYTTDRTRADDPDFYGPLETATGVWIGGGEQDWLTNLYGGTEVENQLKGVLERGGVVAGSSAGAAVMSRVMIASGRTSAVEGRGFGLFPGAIVDQHFLKRNRVRRLMGLVQAHRDLVGFGIDEGTALEVRLADSRLHVIGNSYVMACVPTDAGRAPRIEILQSGDRIELALLREPDEEVLVASEDLDELIEQATGDDTNAS